MTARELLSRLDGVKKSGEGWTALCPGHGDDNPSLSINERDHKVLLHCHAGCATPDVLAALDLTLADLATSNENHNVAGNGTGRREIVAEYRYVDEHGRHLYDVVRFAPKDFRQRSSDGTWSMRGVRRVLYRLPEILTAADVIIVEGERDADNLHELGMTATCNPGGALKWRPEYGDSLVNKHAAIIPDNDESGRQHAGQVARAIHGTAASVRILELPGLTDKGDVSDWVAARQAEGLDNDAIAELLVRMVESTADEYSPETDPQRPGPVIVCLADVEPEEITWIWERRLARGKLSLVIGDPGLGKSTITLDAASRISTGSPWPDGGTPTKGGTILLSAEDGIADTIRRRVDLLGGDPARIHVLTAVRTGDDERPFCLGTDIAMLHRAIDEIGDVRLVVIDPLSAYLGSADSYKDSEIRRVLGPLATLGDRTGVSIAGVLHVSKASDKRAIHRALGSVAFVAAARIVLAVGNDPDDETRRVLAPVKCNLSAPAESLAFRIIQDGSLNWDGTAEGVDADTILSSGGTREQRGERDEAVELLRDLLADGEIAAKEVQAAARENGIAEMTLRRAKGAIGVTVRKDGQPGQRQRWMWSLPAPPKMITDPPKAFTRGNVITFGEPNETKPVIPITSPKMITSPDVSTFGSHETTFEDEDGPAAGEEFSI